MKKDQELIVITKTYDLILWSCNHTSKFPRNHRFVLGERIERNLYNLLETLIAAKYTKNRQRLLEEANLSLEVLRFQMRLAKDLQCLKVESYAFAAKSIDEIGRLTPQVARPERPTWRISSLAERYPERPCLPDHLEPRASLPRRGGKQRGRQGAEIHREAVSRGGCLLTATIWSHSVIPGSCL